MKSLTGKKHTLKNTADTLKNDAGKLKNIDWHAINNQLFNKSITR
jgi:hypothetical protein